MSKLKEKIDLSERISVDKVEVKVDHLLQKRKLTRGKKDCTIYLDRDEHFNTVRIIVISKSQKVYYKVQDNIHKIYSNNVQQGKASIEFETPRDLLMISGANPTQLKYFLSILQKIIDFPEKAHQVELWKEDKKNDYQYDNDEIDSDEEDEEGDDDNNFHKKLKKLPKFVVSSDDENNDPQISKSKKLKKRKIENDDNLSSDSSIE